MSGFVRVGPFVIRRLFSPFPEKARGESVSPASAAGLELYTFETLPAGPATYFHRVPGPPNNVRNRPKQVERCVFVLSAVALSFVVGYKRGHEENNNF